MIKRENDRNITIPQLAKITGLTKSTLDRYIAEMKENEIIFREGSPKGGRWIVL